MGRMGRHRRPHLPGGIFHLAARTLRRERRFTPRLRSVALSTLAEVLPRSQADLLAVAIMPNHLHIVIRQGEPTLAELMQPLLRRLALAVQREHRLKGPVFWRPYGAVPCLDPRHARNAIVYTHLNPVRAKLCADPARYRWTSDALYTPTPRPAPPPELEPLAPLLDPSLALPLFATGPARTATGLRSDYRAFLDWRLSADAVEEGDDPVSDVADDLDRAPRPPSAWGTIGWGESLSPLFHARGRHSPGFHDDGPAPTAPDLATIARTTLTREAPRMNLDSVRGRGGGRERTRLRHLIIRRQHAAGYRNIQIARFLDLSESAVSYVLCLQQPTP